MGRFNSSERKSAMPNFHALHIALCLLAATGLARAQAPLLQVNPAWEWNVAPPPASLSFLGEATGLTPDAWIELSSSPVLADTNVADVRELPVVAGRFAGDGLLTGLAPATAYDQAKVSTWTGEPEPEARTFDTPREVAPRPIVRFHRFTGNGWEFECDPQGARGWCAVFMGATPERVNRLIGSITLPGEPIIRRVAVHERHLGARHLPRYYLQAVISTAGGATSSEMMLVQPLSGQRALEARSAGQSSGWMEPIRMAESISPPDPHGRGNDDISPPDPHWRDNDDISAPAPDPSPAPALVPPTYPAQPTRY